MPLWTFVHVCFDCAVVVGGRGWGGRQPRVRATRAGWWPGRRRRTGAGRLTSIVAPTAAGPWSTSDWRNWRQRVFRPTAAAAGLPPDARPRDLRGSFVSLLVHEGRNIVEVARILGHGPAICLRDYAQVFDEHDPADRMPAEQVIAAARQNMMFHQSSTEIAAV